MERKQHLFIYNRKEMGVLILLGLALALFAFTLGVHLGKRVGGKAPPAVTQGTGTLPTEPDAAPSRVELAEAGKNTDSAVEETLDQSLHEEVAKSGIQLESPRQVELPEKTVSRSGGATTGASETSPSNAEESASAETKPKAKLKAKSKETSALGRPAPPNKYTLQVGSYRQLSEANAIVRSIEEHGVSTYLRAVTLPGKGRWYRIYLGGYDTVDSAEKAGRKLKDRQVIESFIVSNRIE